MGWGSSGDERGEHLGDALDLAFAVAVPALAFVLGRETEVAPVALVDQHHRHLGLAEAGDEFRSTGLGAGVDHDVVVLADDLVQLAVRGVALHAVLDTEDGNLHWTAPSLMYDRQRPKRVMVVIR